MKTILIAFFTLVSISCFSQVSIDPPISYKENLELSKFLFNSFNSYRNSINRGSWGWSDSVYFHASSWNLKMARSGLWGHSDDKYPNYEVIVSVNLEPDQEINYKFIADSCISQILHSSYHRGGFTAPVRTKTLKYSNTEWGPLTLSRSLSDKIAVSAYILDYGHYKRVSVIMQGIATIK
jgi:hypothetical protein